MRDRILSGAAALLCAAGAQANGGGGLFREIGTHVSDAFPDDAIHRPVPIDTHVDSVDYGAPSLLARDGLSWFEVTGTISGRGWGGMVELVPSDPNTTVT